MIIKEKFMPEIKAEAAASRYGLLRTAQGVLAQAKKGWKDQHRTCWCSRSIKSEDGWVGVFQNKDKDGATLAGLNRCGNLHTCPVCAAKVAELRRKQLSAAMVRHVGNGGAAYLATFTFPHEQDETCAELLAKFDKARQRFQNSRQWKSFKKSAGVVGVVNSLEFTVSEENGWHPHIHMLIFCKRKAFNEGEPVNHKGDLMSAMIEDLTRLWCEKVLSVGLGDNSKINDMLKHALNIRGGEKAAEYIAKFGRDERWGASSEIALSHAKVGAAGEKFGIQHFTPFQLLVWIDMDKASRGWAVHRFREYAQAVEGKRALVWSPGLKKALEVEDIDEESWAKTDQQKQDQNFIGSINAEQLRKLLAKKILPQFIVYCGTVAECQAHIDEYFEGMENYPDIARGALLLKEKHGRRLYE